MSSKGYYYLVLNGHLKAEVVEGVIHWAFVEDIGSEKDGVTGKVHPIAHGDMLKVFDKEDSLVWAGVVAYNYNIMATPNPDNPEETIQKIGDKVVCAIQGSARPKDWLSWFEEQYRARLEIRITDKNVPTIDIDGDGVGDLPDRDADPSRIIESVLSEHDKAIAHKPPKPSTEGKKEWWQD